MVLVYGHGHGGGGSAMGRGQRSDGFDERIINWVFLVVWIFYSDTCGRNGRNLNGRGAF